MGQRYSLRTTSKGEGRPVDLVLPVVIVAPADSSPWAAEA